MRRKALVGVVVAAFLPLATPSRSQTPAPVSAPAQKPPATAIAPRWQVQPTPTPAPAAQPQTAPQVTPQTTPRSTRGYATSEFEELLKPREWPRVDDAFGNPVTAPMRQDQDYGMDSAPAYDATRPENPLGPY